ncbi:MAG TPA: baseplate J/gp47 family protein [Candidatus Limnocylindria bacterium]
MARTIVDLDARATVLDASQRLAAALPDGDIALMVAPGAPVLRSGVFLEVLRSELGQRRLSLVTMDARARSVAASVHVPAYSSLAALERHELDPTERIDRARRTAIASVRPSTVAASRPSFRRVGAIAGALAAAALILAAIVGPEATVRVAAAAEDIGPFDFPVRGTVGGTADVKLKTVTQQVTARIPGTLTGARTEERRARGSVQLQNKTTDETRIPKGTIFQTPNGIQFLSTEERTLPRSVIIPGTNLELIIGKIDVPVEAAVAGPDANVAANRITIGPSPTRYTVTNNEPASGGEIKRIPIARLEDYDAARAKAPDALKAEAELQLQKWIREPRPRELVIPRVLVGQMQIAPASADVVGKESFEVTVTGIATAYVAPEEEPRRAIAAKLRESAVAGNDVDDNGVIFDVTSLKVGEDGVTWNVTARGQQARKVDPAGTARMLAGKRVSEVEKELERDRLRLKRLDWRPEWWPLLPLLDVRITVVVER